MNELTVPELLNVLRECAGEPESLPPADEIATTELADIGYDSLAVLEAAGRLQRRYGVDLPEEQVVEASTPAQFVDLLNGHLAAAGSR
jgi:minimal PKS acyl carrier protein